MAHSSPSPSDRRRRVHKSLILLGLTKIPFQNKQPPKASDHPEASPTVNVRSLSSVHRELLPPGPPGASVWAPRVSSQKNGPSFDLEPSYVGGLFLFFFHLFTLWQQALPDWAVTTCHLGMWHPLRPPHKIPNHLRCSRRGSRWETNRTQEDSRNSAASDSTSLWGIHTNMMSYIYTARTITDSVRMWLDIGHRHPTSPHPILHLLRSKNKQMKKQTWVRIEIDRLKMWNTTGHNDWFIVPCVI